MLGTKFGWLLVIQKAPSDVRGNSRWICLCNCGNYVTVRAYALKNGSTRSCGCLRRRYARIRTLKKLGLPIHDRTYRSWNNMVNQALLKKIPIDPLWQKFTNFLADMGEKPAEGWCLSYEPKHGFFKEFCSWKQKREDISLRTIERTARL